MNANESATLPTGNAAQAQGELKTEVATISITRKQLYERIWAESLVHVAPTLGLWPRRLATICAKNGIPMPDRAYWYRSRADRKSMVVPLPDPDRDCEITFVPSQPGPPKPVAFVPEVAPIVVPDNLIRPHRLVREAKKAKASSWNWNGRLRIDGGGLDVLVSQPCRNRAFRIIDTVIKACEARGWHVRTPNEQWPETIVAVEGCDVHVELIEGLRQEPRKLDQREKTLLDEPQNQHKRVPYILVPNGRLTIKVKCAAAWYHVQWGDRKHRRLEDMLDDVIAGIAEGKAAKIRHDKEQAEAKERRHEQERLRYEEEKRQQERQRILMAEQARVDELLADAEAWEESRRLRAYIKASLAKARRAGKPTGRNSEFGKWLIWAREQADWLDPLVKIPPSSLDNEPTPSPPVEERKSFADFMNSLGRR